MRVLVIGGSGLVGRAVCETAPPLGISVVPASRREMIRGLALDLASTSIEADIARICEAAPWDACLLLAGVASFRECAEDPEGTARINVSNTLSVIASLHSHGVDVLFASTSAVFGTRSSHSTETSSPAPSSEYARQKAQVEERCLSDGSARIVRFTKVLNFADQTWSQWIYGWRYGRASVAFKDLKFAPILPSFAARALLHLLEDRHRIIQHVTSVNDIAYFEAAKLTASCLGYGPGLVSASPAPARPECGLVPKSDQYLATDNPQPHFVGPEAERAILMGLGSGQHLVR